MPEITVPARNGPTAPARPRRIATAMLLGLAAVIMAQLLARRSLHGYDAFLALRSAITGEDLSFGTLLYVPLLRAACFVLGPIVSDAFAVLRLLSALGVGLGVAFAYLAAARLRLRAPRLAGLAVLALPAAAYFGATVEVDALLIGTSSVAWWAAIPFAPRPRIGRAASLGAITGLTASLHGGGQLLLAAILAVCGMRSLQRCVRQRSTRPLRRLLAASAITAACHAAIYLLAAMLCAHEGQLTMATNTLALAPHWERMPVTLWQEWLLPYAPHSLLWVLVCLHPRLRWCGLAFACVVGVYFWITNVVLACFEPGMPEQREQGAFFVTIAVPAVLLGVMRLQVRSLRLVVLLGLPLAALFTRLGDWQPEPAGFGAAVDQLDRSNRVWVLCAEPSTDYGWIRKQAGAVPVFGVSEIVREIALRERAGLKIDGALLGYWFDDRFHHVEQDGRQMLISSRALDALRSNPDPRLRALIDDWVPQHYRLEEVASGPFTAIRVLRR